MSKEINEQLIGIFMDSFPDSKSLINLDTKTADIAEWDSMAHILLINKIEEAFRIEFEIDELLSFDSVKSISEVIQKKIKG